MTNFITGIAIGVLWGFAFFFVTPGQKHEIKVSGAIAVYEGKAKCEKALDKWVCKVSKE